EGRQRGREGDPERRALLRVRVALEAKERDREPEREERGDERERGDPARDRRARERQHREHAADAGADRSENDPVERDRVPEDLHLLARSGEPVCDRGLRRAEQRSGEDSARRPRDDARDDALGKPRGRSGAGRGRGAVRREPEIARGERCRRVVDLSAVDAAVAWDVVVAPRPPDDATEERQRLRRPEAERRRDDRLRGPHQVAQEVVLRDLADALAGDRERREHGREDLDRRCERDLPEARLGGRHADRERGEEVHRGGREVNDERERRGSRDDARTGAICGHRRDQAREEARLRVARDARREPPQERRSGPHEDREACGDRREGDRHREKRHVLGLVAEDRDAERKRDEIGDEDAGEAEDLLDQRRAGGLDRSAGEASRVVELVPVEAERRREEGPEEAPDQERPEDVPERQVDALAEEEDPPAQHAGEDPDELDAGREEDEAEEDAGVDLREEVADDGERGGALPLGVRHLVREEQVERADGQRGLDGEAEGGPGGSAGAAGSLPSGAARAPFDRHGRHARRDAPSRGARTARASRGVRRTLHGDPLARYPRLASSASATAVAVTWSRWLVVQRSSFTIFRPSRWNFSITLPVAHVTSPR